MSPADSELFDGSRLFLHEISERSDTSTPVPAGAVFSGFADNVKSMAGSYQFESGHATKNGGSFIGSATWSPQSVLVNPVGGSTPLFKGSSYSHLRYPPSVLL